MHARTVSHQPPRAFMHACVHSAQYARSCDQEPSKIGKARTRPGADAHNHPPLDLVQPVGGQLGDVGDHVELRVVGVHRNELVVLRLTRAVRI